MRRNCRSVCHKLGRRATPSWSCPQNPPMECFTRYLFWNLREKLKRNGYFLTHSLSLHLKVCRGHGCRITHNTPQPTEVGQYKNNSCTLKPKTEFSFYQKQYRNLFFFNLSDYFFQKLKLKFFPLSKSGNSMLFY